MTKAFIYAGFRRCCGFSPAAPAAMSRAPVFVYTKPHCNKRSLLYTAAQARDWVRGGAFRRRKKIFGDRPDRSVLRRFCEDLREMRGSLGGASEPEFSAARASATARSVPGRRRFLFPSRTRATRFRIADIPRRERIRRRCFTEQAARRCRVPIVAG